MQGLTFAMVILYVLGLLCGVSGMADISPADYRPPPVLDLVITSKVTIPNFTLNCGKPLVYTGQDNEAACFARCKRGECQAAVHMSSEQPGKPTCALVPGPVNITGASCKPERSGPHALRLYVFIKEMFSIRKNHNIGDGEGVTGSIASYHPLPLSKRGQDVCTAFCHYLGCNAFLMDSDHCQLFKFTKRPEVLVNGKSPICHKRSVGFYENEKIAPTGECVESG